MSRIVFEVATANYLAGESEKKVFAEAITTLPSSLYPKKASCSLVKGVNSINGKIHGAVNTLVPGTHKFEGDIRLYGGKEGAEFGFFWKSGSPQWLSAYKGMPVNVLLCSINAECAASHLDVMTELWASLCEKYHTIYGYAYLDCGLETGNPRCQGFCLPRLHRYTFLGAEYSSVVDLSKIDTHLRVEQNGEGTFLFRKESWQECLEPNAEEAHLKSLLGALYFWQEGDSWRIPKVAYAVPTIDFSKLECEA